MLATSRNGVSVTRGRRIRPALQLAHLKRVARADLARVEALPEPADALSRAAVGERVGHDVAARLALQPVVANRRGRIQHRLDVALLENMPTEFRVLGTSVGE